MDWTGSRVCSVCGVSKPETAEFFYVTPGRIRKECKDCFKRLKNERYRADPDRAREIARDSYHNADGAGTKRRARAAKPDLYRQIAAKYETANRDERHRARVARHEASRDENNEASKDWYYANLERAKATSRQWAFDHPEENRERIERHRARRAKAQGTVSAAEWRAIRARYGGVCAYCRTPTDNPEWDHVIPLARGGTHTPDNVVPACLSCNRSKSRKLFEEWHQHQIRRGLPVPFDPFALP